METPERALDLLMRSVWEVAFRRGYEACARESGYKRKAFRIIQAERDALRAELASLRAEGGAK